MSWCSLVPLSLATAVTKRQKMESWTSEMHHMVDVYTAPYRCF